MNKPLSEWTTEDVLAFFEKHELTPQQIIPVLGSGALTMAVMAHDHNETEMEEFYRTAAADALAVIMRDLRHRMA